MLCWLSLSKALSGIDPGQSTTVGSISGFTCPDISFKFLTWKTVFLFALASGRRRSEIHAVRRDKLYHSDNWDSVTCQIDHFLCKNQEHSLSGDMFKSFSIPALCPIVGREDKEDRALCPIRALRYYLKRRDKEKQSKTALFVPLRETQGELAKSTLSSWIKDCIVFCLRNCSTEAAVLHRVKAHDVRALAASWSLKGGVPVQDIMLACTWRNHTTFTSHYLKQCSVSDDLGVHRIGPFVAAQSIVSS